MSLDSDSATLLANPAAVYDADVTVVGGAGHAGIPLVLALAEAGLRVNVNDINKASLDMLAAGCLPFIEYGAQAVLKKALLDKRLVFTHSPDCISTGGPVIITIGTPIDEFLNPVRKVVQDGVDVVLPSLADSQLLVICGGRPGRCVLYAPDLSCGPRSIRQTISSRWLLVTGQHSVPINR